MRKKITNLGLISTALSLAVLGSSTVFALPPQANAHAATNTPTTSQGNAPSQANNGKANAAKGLQKACQNREVAITNIMTRIDTRANNQIKLFSTIASRVEAFYTKQGKTVSNYPALVAAVDTAQTNATNDFSTLKTNSNFTCSNSNPKGMVQAFQSYLKTEISDLHAFKTAVKNLIVGVATANGVNVSTTQTTTTPTNTQGGN